MSPNAMLPVSLDTGQAQNVPTREGHARKTNTVYGVILSEAKDLNLNYLSHLVHSSVYTPWPAIDSPKIDR